MRCAHKKKECARERRSRKKARDFVNMHSTHLSEDFLIKIEEKVFLKSEYKQRYALRK